MHFFGRDGGAGPGFPAGFPFFRTGPPPVKNLFRKTRTTGTLFLVVCVKFFAVRIHPIGKKVKASCNKSVRHNTSRTIEKAEHKNHNKVVKYVRKGEK
ncbi:MAG: hypothetical protein C6W57_05875 [Caldibacillus debilis]|nr:MAG: hypothetical protein C6W57_05875 [Caldibacillus debilis]